MKPTRNKIFSVYFVSFIYNLYMFWTSPGPSSGGITVFMSGVQEHMLLYTRQLATQNNKIQSVA